MSMSTGGPAGSMSEINVTPMIDILLVLLIIFMVIVPVTPKGLGSAGAAAAQESANSSNSRTTARLWFRCSIVPGQTPAYKINDTDVNHGDLLAKLTEIYANRAERVMFVRGDDDVNFSYIADVIDIGRAANVDHIGLMTPKIQAGQ